MSTHAHEESLAPTTHVAAGVGANPFGDPSGSQANPRQPDPATPFRQWTIDDILTTAKTPERHASICLRADLEAEHHQILAELATLVDAQGRVVDDEERAADEPSKAARAQEFVDRDQVVLAEMTKAMWYPLFRGLVTDALAEFNKRHSPKGESPDMTAYNTLLVAECSIESTHGPKLTVEDVRQLRTSLGSRAMAELVNTAHAVCTQGGVDFLESPALLRNLKRQ